MYPPPLSRTRRAFVYVLLARMPSGPCPSPGRSPCALHPLNVHLTAPACPPSKHTNAHTAPPPHQFMLDCERKEGGFRGHFWRRISANGGRESLWYSPVFHRASLQVG